MTRWKQLNSSLCSLALQTVPPLSKMEMRFHVAVIARVPVSPCLPLSRLHSSYPAPSRLSPVLPLSVCLAASLFLVSFFIYFLLNSDTPICRVSCLSISPSLSGRLVSPTGAQWWSAHWLMWFKALAHNQRHEEELLVHMFHIHTNFTHTHTHWGDGLVHCECVVPRWCLLVCVCVCPPGR